MTTAVSAENITPLAQQFARLAQSRWEEPAAQYRAADAVLELLEHPGWVAVNELVGFLRENALGQLPGYVEAGHEKAMRHIGFLDGLETVRHAAQGVLVAAEQTREQYEGQTAPREA